MVPLAGPLQFLYLPLKPFVARASGDQIPAVQILVYLDLDRKPLLARGQCNALSLCQLDKWKSLPSVHYQS